MMSPRSSSIAMSSSTTTKQDGERSVRFPGARFGPAPVSARSSKPRPELKRLPAEIAYANGRSLDQIFRGVVDRGLDERSEMSVDDMVTLYAAQQARQQQRRASARPPPPPGAAGASAAQPRRRVIRTDDV
jgi:hypothetical protein